MEVWKRVRGRSGRGEGGGLLLANCRDGLRSLVIFNFL